MSEVKTDKISSVSTNGDITLDPDGTGDLIVVSGNVGIGTASPSANLEISNDGNAKIDIVDSGSGDPAVRLSVANSAGYVGTTTNHSFRFIANDSEVGRFLSGGGLTFNGDTAAANALDDYEEGTWTPNVGGTATYTDRYGKYQKVGNTVHVQFKIEINNIGTGSTNQLSGFPFTSANLGQVQTGCVSFYGSLAQNVTWVAFYIENNAITAQFVSEDGTADPHLNNGTAIFGNAATLFGAASYFVN